MTFNEETLELFRHLDGAFIRELTPTETTLYFDLLARATREEREQGLVEGRHFGEDGTVYAS